MKKIFFIVNKNWEVEPFLDALINNTFRPPGILLKGATPAIINSPADGSDFRQNTFRANFVYKNSIGVDELDICVWCIQDLMSPTPVSSSSSEDKFVTALPKIFAFGNPDMVIAVGTAGFIGETSYNGSVVSGAEFFVHDAKPPVTSSHFTHPDLEKLLPGNVHKDLFHPVKGIFTSEFKYHSEAKMLSTPNHPSQRPLCIAGHNYTALSFVNITDYKDYAWADHEGIEAYNSHGFKSPIGSVETTHGLIKLATPKPIFFLSGITDRIGHFNMEVTPLQNYVAAFNCGIVAGQIIPVLNKYL
jgi:hypothetical protein